MPKNIFFFFILPLAAGIRLYRLGGKQLWVDEILQVLHSLPASLKGIFLAVREDTGSAPLDYLIQHVFLAELGVSEFSARLHAALLGIIAVVLLYYCAQMLFDRGIANGAALLFAVYPLHHHYSQEGRPYALFVCLTLASYLVFLQLLRKRTARHWFYYTAVTVLLLYAHYYAGLVILSQSLFLGLLRRPAFQTAFVPGPPIDRRFLTWFFLAVAIAAALFTPWALFVFRSVYHYRFTPEHFGGKLLLRIIHELSDRSYLLSFLLILLASLGVLRLRSARKKGHLAFLLLWLLLPLPPILAIIWLKDYFFAIRQILFATPALFILAAHGVRHFADACARANYVRRSKAMALTISLVLLVSVVVIIRHLPDRRSDFKAVGHFLRRNVSRGDIVIAPHVEEVLSYYFRDIPSYAQDGRILCRLDEALAPGRRVYIVKSRLLSRAERDLIDGAYRPNWETRTFTFRKVQITELTARRDPVRDARELP